MTKSIKKQLSFFIIICMVLVLPAHAASDGKTKIAERSNEPIIATEESSGNDKGNLWLGLGVGTLIGFGSGHALQDRWNSIGWAFTAADGLGFLLLIGSMGSSPSGRSPTQRDLARTGGILLISSRVVQIIELAVFGVNNGMLAGEEAQANSKTNSVFLIPEITNNSYAVRANVFSF